MKAFVLLELEDDGDALEEYLSVLGMSDNVEGLLWLDDEQIVAIAKVVPTFFPASPIFIPAKPKPAPVAQEEKGLPK